MSRYSYSKISEFENCPLKYRFRYIDRIEKPSSIEAFVGSVVHGTLKEVMDVWVRFGKVLDPASAVLIYSKNWEAEFSDEIAISKEYLSAGDYFRKGEELVRAFFEMERFDDEWRVLGLEKRFLINLEGHTLEGFIDRLERRGNVFRIVDYKTTDYPRPPGKTSEDMQLRLYSLAVAGEFPEAERFLLEWYFLSSREVFSLEMFPSDLKWLADRLTGVMLEIENTTEYLPLGRKWCPCEYEVECEREKETRRLKESGVTGELSSLVETYVGLLKESEGLAARKKEIEREIKPVEAALKEIALSSRAWEIEGVEHVLKVEIKKCLRLPEPGTEERKKLDQIVRECGLWDGLSQLEKRLLIKAVDERVFGMESEEVASLLREEETVKFVPRLKERR